MHDINTNSGKYVVASIGVVASLFMLMVSAYLNGIFMFRLGKTPLDGYVYAAAGVSADVLMALCPFFFFACFRNREWVRGGFTLLLWVALTAFSAQSAIGHLAGSRTEASAGRTVAATSYSDSRKDLEAARRELGFIPEHRPTATVLAAISKHKISPTWIQSNECTQPVGNMRKYCSAYADLTAELANAMAADKVNERIETLKKSSENLAATHGGVVGDADPGAATISKLTGLNVKDTQSVLNLLGALILLMGAGLGPYVSLSTVQKVENSQRRKAKETREEEVAAVAAPSQPLMIDITPQPPKNPAGYLPSPQDITPDARELLRAIGMPQKACDKRPKDSREVLGYRFYAWCIANKLVGDFSADQVDDFYAAYTMADNRDAWGTRVAKTEFEAIGQRFVSSGLRMKEDGSRGTVWTIKPVQISKLMEILRKRGIVPKDLPPPEPETVAEASVPPPESPKNVFRLFGSGGGEHKKASGG